MKMNHYITDNREVRYVVTVVFRKGYVVVRVLAVVIK
jgi:hypothetical protein